MLFNNKNHISFCANRSENCTKRFEIGLHFVLGLISDAYVNQYLLNGKPIQGVHLPFTEIVKGGKLEVQMHTN